MKGHWGLCRDFVSTYDELLTRSNFSSQLMHRIRLILYEVFKCIKELNPENINKLVKIKSTGYSFRNIRLHQFIPKTTTYGLRSFSYTGAKLWNDIGPIIDDSTEPSHFKTYLADLDISLDPTFSYVWNSLSNIF